ncbi:MAG: ParA family protein, partial [Candidatus Competibacteraceae bacterium]|nr:ParA family protein [Candidatus Competibacteraceae bacterium]
LAVNLAGYFARRGRRVLLSDLDPQRSALDWLARRPAQLPLIHPWDGSGSLPLEPQVVIIDSPAALEQGRLKSAVKHVDRVVVPVQPSPLDIEASGRFLETLLELKKVRKGKVPVALVGNRVDPRTVSARELEGFLGRLELPLLGLLRESQLYVHTAREGSTLFDLPRYRVIRDLNQWRGILAWLD